MTAFLDVPRASSGASRHRRRRGPARRPPSARRGRRSRRERSSLRGLVRGCCGVGQLVGGVDDEAELLEELPDEGPLGQCGLQRLERLQLVASQRDGVAERRHDLCLGLGRGQSVDCAWYETQIASARPPTRSARRPWSSTRRAPSSSPARRPSRQPATVAARTATSPRRVACYGASAATTSSSSGNRPALHFENTRSPSSSTSNWPFPPGVADAECPAAFNARPRDSRPVCRSRFRSGSRGSRQPRRQPTGGATWRSLRDGPVVRVAFVRGLG